MITDLIVGGLIHHIVYDKSMPFDAIMFQPNIIVKWDSKVNLLVGKNSIDDPIFGIGYDFPIAAHPRLGSINLKLGAYFQDQNKFDDLKLETPLSCDVMPIFGVEFNIPYNDTAGISTILTPGILFTGIHFRF